MYTLFREIGVREALYREFIPFTLAFIVAELFYKFGSFSLECVAFFATWAFVSSMWSILIGQRARR